MARFLENFARCLSPRLIIGYGDLDALLLLLQDPQGSCLPPRAGRDEPRTTMSNPIGLPVDQLHWLRGLDYLR